MRVLREAHEGPGYRAGNHHGADDRIQGHGRIGLIGTGSGGVTEEVFHGHQLYNLGPVFEPRKAG
jgi:hypothetical protein